MSPRIDPGKRALVAGRTGSGKSTLGNWLLTHSPLHWIILNPKHTKAYAILPESITVKGLDWNKIDKALKNYRYVIVNPTTRETNADTLDEFILRLHEDYTSLGLCIDELYAVHKSAIAGQGLIAWLTRGRELKQSFLGLTQRPAWLSQFLFSESDYIVGMALTTDDDLKRMSRLSGRKEFNARVPPRHWLWYDVAAEQMQYFGPVPISQ